MPREPRRPSRDAVAVRPPRALGDVARPHATAPACVALWALDLWPPTPGEVMAVVLAAALLVVVAGWLWVRRTRAEVRAAEAPPFLLPRWRPSGIVGAESEPTAVIRPVAEPAPAQPAPAPARPARPAPRTAIRAMPTPEMPVVPLAGGVHAILVSAVADAAPAAGAGSGSAAAGPGPAPGAAAGGGSGVSARASFPTANGVTTPGPVAAAGGGAPAARAASPAVTGVPAPAAVMPAVEVDATLQLLPGRFELGAADRPDIRFVRQPGRATEITIGRQAGEAQRHIRLDAPTVSRLHARLSFDERRWSITNLSRTNPVRVNGQVLAETMGPRLLAEGDRVEIGEFLLVFRER